MDSIQQLIWAVIGAVFGAIVSFVVDRTTIWRHAQFKKRQPLQQILNFGDDDLLFFFPHRDNIREAVLPRTSTEDFLAINNFMSALINLGWQGKVGVRDTIHAT